MRDELLEKFAEKNARAMFDDAGEETERALRELLGRRVNEIIGLAVGSVSLVEAQLEPFFTTDKAPASTAARLDRKLLEADIKPHLTSWELCWQKPSAQRDDHVMRGDWSIPRPRIYEAMNDL